MKTIVLLSGGVDSTVLLYDRLALKDEVIGLSFDYGQRHNLELRASERIAKVANINRLVSLIPNFGLDYSGYKLKGSSQTDTAIQVPEGHYTDESMKQTVVPNRNMVMLSIAVALAISERAERVCFAAHAGDHAIYPDCRLEFVDSMRATTLLANKWTPVIIEAPFVSCSKTQIVARGAHLKVPFDLTYSCYKGHPIHCGVCGTCVERKEAFREAQVEDPTRYER